MVTREPDAKHKLALEKAVLETVVFRGKKRTSSGDSVLFNFHTLTYHKSNSKLVQAGAHLRNMKTHAFAFAADHQMLRVRRK